MNHAPLSAALLGLLASCASITGPLPGVPTDGRCGVDKVTVLALGME